MSLHCKECGSMRLVEVEVADARLDHEHPEIQCVDCGYIMEAKSDLFQGNKYIVCPICKGEGKYVNPSIDSQGLTADDFAEDPDFAEDYVAGRYDVKCKCCSGDRVVTKEELDDYEDRLVMFQQQMAEQGERYGDSRL